METVELTVKTDLCISCGICKNICPKDAISWKREDGMYHPVIDKNLCIKCGKCTKVCPGLEMSYSKNENVIDTVCGKSIGIYNAWSKNPDIRHASASGGVISTVISNLLERNIYDVAFTVDTYSYDTQVKTNPIEYKDVEDGIEHSKYPKSRYIPISHENAINYLKKNDNKRIIFIGTSCAIQGLRKVIKILNSDENNYLLIGLFCDKVFNYNVYDYFQDKYGIDKRISAIHFKNKDSGGWPGNMKFLFDDGTSCYIDKTERCKIKNYFMPEKCLYCIDKLNVHADISLGDNYTDQNSSSLGSNSVIIRTTQGETAWKKVCDKLEYETVDKESIRRGQYLDDRLLNRYFAVLKQRMIKKNYGTELELNKGILITEPIVNYEQAWKRNLAMLKSGRVYNQNKKELNRQFEMTERFAKTKHPIVLFTRVFYGIKRKINKG